MPHSSMCLWKRYLISEKLKRQITLEEVHALCDYLGFVDPYETLRWIEKATPEEIEEKLRLAKKRRKKRDLEEQYLYVYAA